ncbi:MAG: proline racemase family protein [Bifidobacteriaceae bacterium]|jgi:proline racemase|nr:proline racemase family protein [Bifidobacteriaceae bacterium]
MATSDAHVTPAGRHDLAGLTHPVRIGVTDYHTAGEPFRIVTSGTPTPPGATVLDRRTWLREHLDAVRRLLVNEPRGHADMYGAFVVPPNPPCSAEVDTAAFGAVFFHKDGYSTACGHGTIALATWALDTGLVQATDDGEATFAIDVPSGRVQVVARRAGGRVEAARFRNVPSWVAARDLAVATSRGEVRVDVSYGGAFYASARAADLGLRVAPEDLGPLVEIGREIKWALNEHPSAVHPADPRLTGMYGTIWWEDLEAPHEVSSLRFGLAATPGRIGTRQRNVTVFADGEVDRSPCGSGTSARLALLAEDGRVAPGHDLEHLSIVDTRFIGRILGAGPALPGTRGTVLTEVEGTAHLTGHTEFVLDPHDDLGLGFQLR